MTRSSDDPIFNYPFTNLPIYPIFVRTQFRVDSFDSRNSRRISCSPRRQLLQLCSRLINCHCFFLQDGSYDGYCFGRLSPLVLLNGFTDCGHGLDRISGICAGRINLVLEPGPSGKSFVAQEKAFTLVEFFIESGQSRGGNTAAILSKFLQGCVIALRCLLQCLNTILERTGARCALLTTQGFRDIYEIGRVNRPESYNLFFRRHQPLIDRVVANLLSNAIKFSPSPGGVDIVTTQRNDCQVIEIWDRGPGIASEEVTELFRRYGRRIGARTDSTGLGLFIVKTIVEAHGGTVEVRARPEGGSVFAVSLPLERNI